MTNIEEKIKDKTINQSQSQLSYSDIQKENEVREDFIFLNFRKMLSPEFLKIADLKFVSQRTRELELMKIEEIKLKIEKMKLENLKKCDVHDELIDKPSEKLKELRYKDIMSACPEMAGVFLKERRR